MNFSEITNINIPEGVVKKITTLEGVILWEKSIEPDYLTLPKPNNNEIYYTSSDKEDPLFRPYTNFLSDNTIISNTYENGIGKIVFEKDLVSVWKYAFDVALSRNSCRLTLVRLPDSIKNIGEYAFYNQEELTSINIPYGVEYIDNKGFGNCALTSIDIPDTVKYIYDYTFQNCYYLTKLVLPDSIIYIGNGTCYGCEKLKYIRLPENIESLRYQCFSNCKKLETITLPPSLEIIDQECFSSCDSLHTIISKAVLAPSLGYKAFFNMSTKVPEGTPKILYIPNNATGYDIWLSQLKGFTIEYITE